MIAYVLSVIRESRVPVCTNLKLTHASIAFILYRYGERIRGRSPAAIQLARQLEEAERKREARIAAKQEKAALRQAQTQPETGL
jgi:hypothetical protein